MNHVNELMIIFNKAWNLSKYYTQAVSCAHSIEIMNILYKEAYENKSTSLISLEVAILSKLKVIEDCIGLMEDELNSYLDGATTEKIRKSVNELKEFVEREKEKHNFDFSPDPLPPVILPTSKNDN